MAQKKQKGTKIAICQSCGALLPSHRETCLVCGTPVHGVQKDSSPTVPFDSGSPKVIQHERTFLRRISIILLVLLLGSGVAVGSWQYLVFQTLIHQYSTKDAILYQQDSTNLKIRLDEFTDPFVIRTDYLQGGAMSAKDSFDERYVAYLNNTQMLNGVLRGDLFLLDIASFGKQGSSKAGIPVTSDRIIDYQFSSDRDQLVYLTEKQELFLCDYSGAAGILPSDTLNITKLYSGASAIAGISGDQLLFLQGSRVTPATLPGNRKITRDKENGKTAVFSLFLLSMESPQPPRKIDDSVCDILDTSPDYSTILYAKQKEPAPLVKYNLFSFSGADSANRLLAENVAHIVETNAETGALLYLVPNEQSLRYESLFVDDLKADDSALEQTRAVAIPDVPNETAEDGPTPEELAQEAAAAQAYEEKVQRDSLRAHLQSSIRDYKREHYLSYSLYYQPSLHQEPHIISQEVFQFQDVRDLVKSSIPEDYAVFVTSDLARLKPEKFSDLTVEKTQLLLSQPLDLQAHLAEHLPETLMVVSLSSELSKNLYTEPGERVVVNYLANHGARQVLFVSRPSYNSLTGPLYSATTDKANNDRVELIDEVANAPISFWRLNNQEFLYQSISRSIPPDYTLYESGSSSSQEIATNIGSAFKTWIPDTRGEELLFMTNYNEETGLGMLYHYDRKVILLGENVQKARYYPDRLLLLTQREDKSFVFIEQTDAGLVMLDVGVGECLSFGKPFLTYHS